MSLSTLMSALLLLTALGYVSLGARILAARRGSGNPAIGVLFLLVSVWVAGGALELVATTLPVFLVGRTAHFIGTALIPVVALVGFREYTNRASRRRDIALLLVIPLLSIGLAASNGYHHWMWLGQSVDADGTFLARPDRWGQWFLIVHAPYSYAVIGAAVIRLLAHAMAVARADRRRLLLVGAACVLPIAATLAYDFGVGPNTVSYVPFAFAVMLPIYAWLFVVERVIEFKPLAFETVFQNMQDPVVVVDGERRILGLNRTAESMLDMEESEALHADLDTLFGDASTCVVDALATGKPGKLLTDSGRFLHVRSSPIATGDSAGVAGHVLMFRDVSDVEQAQADVRNSERLLRTLIDLSANGILRLRWADAGDNGERVLRCIFANAAAGRFLDVDAVSLVDRDAIDIVRLATSGMETADADDVIEVFEHSIGAAHSLDVEVCQRSAIADRWLRLVVEPIGEDIAITLIDVTDGKVRERRMESIALSDPLTGVLNRRGFERQASRRLFGSADDATGALLFIDLNGFKAINDRCGHEVGDQLLTIAAARLLKSLRPMDIIGRPGGDEFVALVPDVSAETADRLAKRLTVALEEPYVIGSESLRCTASIGLALYPANATTLTGLLREADQAMYRAKARSRDVPLTHGDDLLEKAI